MILTATFNPSIDYLVSLDNIQVGKLNRTSSEKFVIGGKGINVSLMLSVLDINSSATGFISGFTGSYISDTLNKNKHIKDEFVKVDSIENTRINLKINSFSEETEINALGPYISEKDYNNLKEKVLKLTNQDTFILSGSLAKGLEDSSYEELAEICYNNCVNLVIDISKKSLLDLCKYKPFLIKPNTYELEQLFDVSIKNDKDTIKYGKKLYDLGAKNVLVSQGKDGAILITEDKIYKTFGINITPKSTIGAGDSMVGGFIAGYEKTKCYIEALKIATACSVATACSEGIGNYALVKEYLKEVKIKEV